MCRTGSNERAGVTYNILVRSGWKPGQSLCVSGKGLKRTLKGGVNSDEYSCQSEIRGILILLENQFNNVVECNEVGIMCEFCAKRGLSVYTMFHELDGSEDEGIDYSLPKLPEVCVWLYGRNMNALIDTGSQISGITRELYGSIISENESLPEIAILAIQIQGAFGSRSESTNRLVQIEFRLGSTLIEATVLVMRRLPRSLILGYDWLERMKGVVNCGSERTLTIEHLGVKSCVRLNSDCKVERLGREANAATINLILNQNTRPKGHSVSSEESGGENQREFH